MLIHSRRPVRAALTVSLALMIVGTILTTGAPLMAQVASQASIDQDLKMLRQDLRSDRKQIVATNLQLTDDEAVKFWPVFDRYTAELGQLNDGRAALIKEYAATYSTMTNEQAVSLIRRTFDADQALVQLRQKYIPLVQNVLPGTKTARFFQIDRRIGLLVELQVGSGIPLVNP